MTNQLPCSRFGKSRTIFASQPMVQKRILKPRPVEIPTDSMVNELAKAESPHGGARWVVLRNGFNSEMNNTTAIFKKGSNLPDGYVTVLKWLLGIGQTLENPRTGKITHYNGPGEGPFETDAHSILESLARGGEGSVQLWFAVDAGAFLSWTADELLLDFDGLTDPERQAVIHALTDNLFARDNWLLCRGCTLELVVD